MDFDIVTPGWIAQNGEAPMVHPYTDRPPGPGISVDTQALTDFAAAMRSGVQGTITPNGDRLASSFATGVQFGADNPSTDVKALIAKYRQCLDAISAQLYTYEIWAKVLVEAAEQIGSNYQSADALAKTSIADVTTLFNQAVTDVYRPGSGPRGTRPE